MRSSSFLCGVFLGAVGAMWASKRRMGLMSGQRGSLMGFANLAKNKSNGTFQSHDAEDAISHGAAHGAAGGTNLAHKADVKESNLKLIKEFINGNPEVKREVEQILKDTHSVIPGI